MLNSGDVGLLRSLDMLSASAASRATDGGATIAAHAQHVRYGLSLMNRWASEGGNPFADARWEEPWKIGEVDAIQWQEIRSGLRDEARPWMQALGSPRDVNEAELAGMIASIAHVAYHLGALQADRQEPARAERRHVRAGALKQPPIGQSDCRQHAVRDGIDADRLPDECRPRPAVGVDGRVVAMPVHQDLRTVVAVRKCAGSPNESLRRLFP